MSQKIKIVEVGPRDGLQNESTIVQTVDKLHYIKLLVDAGLKEIEATSFVKPESIKQMQDAKKLFESLRQESFFPSIDFPCLVPNLKGLESAHSVGVRHIAFFTATSEEFNKKNINCSVKESYDRLDQILANIDTSIKVRGYISTVFECPYEGKINEDKVLYGIEEMFKRNITEISLGDTIGSAYPEQVENLLVKVKSRFDLAQIAMHFHDTKKNALSNIEVSLDQGITIFDSSSGGLGGCPYAKGATGNVATEDVVHLLESKGISTGIDEEKLYKASKFILSKVGKISPSKHFKTLEAKYV